MRCPAAVGGPRRLTVTPGHSAAWAAPHAWPARCPRFAPSGFSSTAVRSYVVGDTDAIEHRLAGIEQQLAAAQESVAQLRLSLAAGRQGADVELLPPPPPPPPPLVAARGLAEGAISVGGAIEEHMELLEAAMTAEEADEILRRAEEVVHFEGSSRHSDSAVSQALCSCILMSNPTHVNRIVCRRLPEPKSALQSALLDPVLAGGIGSGVVIAGTATLLRPAAFGATVKSSCLRVARVRLVSAMIYNCVGRGSWPVARKATSQLGQMGCQQECRSQQVWTCHFGRGNPSQTRRVEQPE